MGIEGSGLDAPMSEQDLNGPNVGSRFEQVCGETVPKRVNRHAFAKARGFAYFFARVVHRLGRHWTIRVLAGKEPGTRAILRSSETDLPILSKEFEQPRGEHDVAIFVALRLVKANDHSAAVDVLHAQGDNLRDRAGRQRRPSSEWRGA